MNSSTSNSKGSRPVGNLKGLQALASGLLLALLLLAGATEALVRVQVAPQDTLKHHLGLLESATSPNAAFGDSHVARGFHASEGFLNLAYPSENINDMLEKARWHYRTTAPGRVILQADPHLFAPYRLRASSQPVEERLKIRGKPWILAATARHRPRLVAYWGAFLRGFGTLESRIQQTESGALLSSGDFSSLTPRKRRMEARTRLRHHTVAAPGYIANAQQQYSELIEFLSERGATICLVSFPVTQEYRVATVRAEQRGNSPAHGAIIAYFEELASNNGARYIDARAHIGQLHLFRDVDHLNPEGVSVFSASVIERCFEGR